MVACDEFSLDVGHFASKSSKNGVFGGVTVASRMGVLHFPIEIYESIHLRFGTRVGRWRCNQT